MHLCDDRLLDVIADVVSRQVESLDGVLEHNRLVDGHGVCHAAAEVEDEAGEEVGVAERGVAGGADVERLHTERLG